MVAVTWPLRCVTRHTTKVELSTYREHARVRKELQGGIGMWKAPPILTSDLAGKRIRKRRQTGDLFLIAPGSHKAKSKN